MASGEDLRALMRHVPHNVAVLTVDHEGDRMGVTISSLVSLSLDPPLVGVSVGKQASLYALLRNAGRFAVSLLGSGQEDLARRFAAGRPPIVHWEGVATREGRFAPLIEGALGWIEGRTVAEHDAGDHTFFIADAVAVEQGVARSALMYREGTYHEL
jgi:flavin reductase (DIM6/NTAB) family NADH-FMN oxidoreductase RutF